MRWTVLALFAMGCATPEVAPGELPAAEADEAAIYNGTPATAPHHGSTVAIYGVIDTTTTATSYCTGTLIAPDVVLTAAHCLDVASYGANDWQEPDPRELVVYVGDDPQVAFFEHIYSVKEARIHPGYDRWALVNDIGLIRLWRSVKEDVTPIPVLPKALAVTNADAGRLMDYVGFGEQEDGGYDEKLHITLPLAGLGCVVPGCLDGGDPATQFSYSMAPGGPCFGDSGGPTYIQRSGNVYVAGITSYGDPYCLEYGVQTKVDAYSNGVQKYIDRDPTAAEAEGPGVCGDGVCNEGESCDGRDTTTACGDCPGNLGGNPAGRYCWFGSTCVGLGC